MNIVSLLSTEMAAIMTAQQWHHHIIDEQRRQRTMTRLGRWNRNSFYHRIQMKMMGCQFLRCFIRHSLVLHHSGSSNHLMDKLKRFLLYWYHQYAIISTHQGGKCINNQPPSLAAAHVPCVLLHYRHRHYHASIVFKESSCQDQVWVGIISCSEIKGL